MRRVLLLIISAVFVLSVCTAEEKVCLNAEYSLTENQVVKNLKDILNLIQVAENYLLECQSLLQKSRDIAVKGSNGIYKENKRKEMISEIINNICNYNLIVNKATFNGISLFYSKSNTCNSYQVTFSEVEEPETIILHLPNYNGNMNKLDEITNILQPTPRGFDITINKIDDALILLEKERARLDAEKSRMEYAISFEDIYIQNITNEIVEKQYHLLIDKIYSLAIRSANGIYNDVDRYCLDYKFNKLIIELMREEKISNIKSKLSLDKSDNILTPDNAAKVLIKINQEIRNKIFKMPIS